MLARDNEQRAAPNVKQKERIKWPKSNETSDFEGDVDTILKLVLMGGVDRTGKAMLWPCSYTRLAEKDLARQNAAIETNMLPNPPLPASEFN